MGERQTDSQPGLGEVDVQGVDRVEGGEGLRRAGGGKKAVGRALGDGRGGRWFFLGPGGSGRAHPPTRWGDPPGVGG